MKRFAIWLLFALVLSACGSGTSVAFKNQSESRLEGVELSGNGFKASLGVVSPGQSLAVKVYPSGESGLSVSFVANGRSYSYEPQDYFEGGGMYKISAIVDRDLSISVQSDIRP